MLKGRVKRFSHLPLCALHIAVRVVRGTGSRGGAWSMPVGWVGSFHGLGFIGNYLLL